MPQKTEPELIADCKLGDKAAMTELFGRHYASSLRLARRVLRSEDESQDAVQSAYVSALRYFHSFRGDATFKAWIARIVMNHCLARLHERRRRRDWVSVDDLGRSEGVTMLASATPTPEKFTQCQEIASALSEAAAALPKPLREVFALCAFSGLSLKEAAAALGLTVNATKTRLFRAHARMRSHLQPMWSDMRIHGTGRHKNAANQLRRGGRDAVASVGVPGVTPSHSAKDSQRLGRPNVAPIPSVSNGQGYWAVLLAGGDGTRLRNLTLKISGDLRPKQFCRIWGDKSLLSWTRQRLRPLFRSNQTMFVLTRTHERFYREDLPPGENSCILVQPENRGTGVAITAAILGITQCDADAVVAFFPCDHYYSDDDAFTLAIRSAMAFAEEHPTSLILLGAEAHYPEVEYGWIEPGPTIGDLPLSRVNRFWEKPSLLTARALLRRGCLWNTFVTIGRAETFLELLRSEIPDVVVSVAAALTDKNLDSAFREVRAVDFSHEVLAAQPHRLLVFRDASGWADLGNTARVVDTLVRNNIEPAWLSEMRREAELMKS